MSESAETNDDLLCEYCGAPVPGLWFGLEIERPAPTTDGGVASFRSDWRDLTFCNQEHAALWLQTPLPAVEPVRPDKEIRRPSLLDRIIEPLFAVGALVALALVAVGAYTVLRWLFDR